MLNCRTASITALVLALAVVMSSPLRAQQFVDLELVLAVDISLSMDFEEQRLQRDGYVAALRDPQVIKAIGSGPQGRIALTYVEWAGFGIQRVVVPWQVVGTASEVRAFADKLAQQPISRARRTSISSALDFSAKLFSKSGVRGLRRVIDVSGDGPNNAGPLVLGARNKVVQSGITVNGLAIQLERPGQGIYSYFDIRDLVAYYEDCVIGGAGAFALAIRKRGEFATAIRQKLLLEIAGAPTPPASLIHRAGYRQTQFAMPKKPQRSRARTDCQVGEKRWQQFWEDQE